jgi:hypothetical protein
MLDFLRIDMVLIVLQTIAGFLFRAFSFLTIFSLIGIDEDKANIAIAVCLIYGYIFAVLTYTLVTR